jgi:hypothetical protein
LKADGVYGRFGLGHLEKLLFRDKRAARAAIDRMLGWDFDRVIVAHGDIVESRGKEAVREAFAWLPS